MDNYSPELAELCTHENLLERSRISEQGHAAARFALFGSPYLAKQFAMQAAHDARLLFPDMFLWQDERYGQQLTLNPEVAA